MLATIGDNNASTNETPMNEISISFKLLLSALKLSSGKK